MTTRIISFSDSGSSSPPPAHPPSVAPAGKTSRPLKRAAPRFLGDDGSDDDDVQSRHAGAKSNGRRSDRAPHPSKRRPAGRTTAEDVDRLFADLDRVESDGNDDDDDDALLRLPPPLTKGRHADARAPDPTQDSVIDDRITAFGNGKAGKGKGKGKAGGADGEGDEGMDDKIDGEAGEKKRKAPRKRALMNEERLLGERGLKKLKENFQGFKVKGKGQEHEDLRRLCTVYQLWAHQMFPSGTFKDTMRKVEKLCHKKGVKYQIKVWRDEANGIFLPQRGQNDSDDDAGQNSRVIGRDSAPAEDAVTTSQAGSPDPNRPKKSYFDDIPSSSPGGALSRDDGMAADDLDEEDESDLASRLFGARASVAPSQASDVFGGMAQGRQRSATGAINAFDDVELDLDDGPDDFDMDLEAEAAMREMETMEQEEAGPSRKGKDVQAQAEHRATSFYGPPKASKPPAVAPTEPSNVKIAGSGLIAENAQTASDEDNFDDFDFGEDEDVLREMEMLEQSASKPPTSALPSALAGSATSPTTTPSLSTSITETEELDGSNGAFEEDEEFLKDMEAEVDGLQPQLPADTSATEQGVLATSASPTKETPLADLIYEEEEDLYS